MTKTEASKYAIRRLKAFGAAVEAATHQSLQESGILLGPSPTEPKPGGEKQMPKEMAVCPVCSGEGVCEVQRSPRKKPTIEELQKILDSPTAPLVSSLPSGELVVVRPNSSRNFVEVPVEAPEKALPPWLKILQEIDPEAATDLGPGEVPSIEVMKRIVIENARRRKEVQ
jgi:hypothetical protein